jgi:pyridoxamine 5'-phosphate oxidase
VIWNPRPRRLLLPQIWRNLENGCREWDHPFRTAVLGTAGPETCHLRTVVLREAERRSRRLVCHTDARSGKVAQIRACPEVEWLFYDPVAKVQVLARATAVVHQNSEKAREAWRETPLPSRINYCMRIRPGKPMARPESAWPRSIRERRLTVAESEAGYSNFALIVTELTRIEFLKLDLEGHHRATFTWTGKRFAGTWVAP